MFKDGFITSKSNLMKLCFSTTHDNNTIIPMFFQNMFLELKNRTDLISVAWGQITVFYSSLVFTSQKIWNSLKSPETASYTRKTLVKTTHTGMICDWSRDRTEITLSHTKAKMQVHKQNQLALRTDTQIKTQTKIHPPVKSPNTHTHKKHHVERVVRNTISCSQWYCSDLETSNVTSICNTAATLCALQPETISRDKLRKWYIISS